MALGYSWTTIDSATIASNYTFILQARLVSQSTDSNTSTIATRIIWSFPSSAYSYASSNTTYYVSGMGSASDSQYVSYSGTSGVVCSSEYTIGHSEDGTLSDSVSGWIDFGGVGTSTGVMSGSFDLPTINRISKVSCSSKNIYPYGTTYTLSVTRYVSTYTHTLRYVFGTLSGTIATGVTTSATWTPDRSMLSAIPNQTSNSNLRVYCDTYSGSTLIGTSYVSLVVKTSAAYSSPEISTATVTEDTTEYGITDAQTVALLSEKTITVTANTQDYSSLVSIAVTNGSQTVTYTPSSTVTSATATFTMTNLTTGYYVVTVTDGRGYTSSTTVTTDFYEYILPTITTAKIERPEPTADYGVLTLAGQTYYGPVGDTANSLTIDYTYVETGGSTTYTGVTTVTPTYSDTGATTWSVTELTLGDTFSYQKQYDVSLTITDSLGNSVTASIHVLLGIPVYSWGEDHFNVYGKAEFVNREDLTDKLLITCDTVIPLIKTAKVIENQSTSVSASTTTLTFDLPDDFGTSLGCHLALRWAGSTWSNGTVTIVNDGTLLSGTGSIVLHSDTAQTYTITVVLVYISNADNY